MNTNDIANTESNNKTSDKISTDLLIIGGGPGGYVAAIYAAKNGLDVTLVEKEALGGTCLNIGCIPTKVLVQSSQVYENIRNSKEFGIDIKGDLSVNMEQVIARKDSIVKRLVSGVEFLMKKNKINVILGEGSFISKNKVRVSGDNDYIISAKDIIIATGSKISNVSIPGIDSPFVLNSTTALESTDLPESITIIGGGVIGMEFAFIYNSLGVEVNVVESLDRTLNMVDKDVSREIQKLAKRKKIKIHTKSKVTEIKESKEGKAVVVYEDKKGQHSIETDKILVAIGREPNLESLNLESTGLILSKNSKGIKVNNEMRTNIDHIYAIGDVTNIIQLAHVASHQGIVAVDNILNKDSKMDYKMVPNVIFTSPEIATIGIGEDQAKEQGLDISVSKIPFMGNGKALVMNERNGFVKLIKNNTSEEIIGASVIGPDASNLIATLTTIVANGLSEDQINKTIFPHPTTSEVIGEASMDLSLGAIHS